MAKTMTAKEVADEVGVDPKKLRRYLRSDASPITPVGQGNRYAITKSEMNKLRKVFASDEG